MLYISIVTPLQVAFFEEEDQLWFALNLLVDVLFLGDIAINCFSAFYKEDSTLVVAHKQILWNYFTGWMLLDFAAAVPVQLLFDSESN